MFTWILRNNVACVFLLSLGIAAPLKAASAIEVSPFVWTEGHYGQYSPLEPTRKFQQDAITLKTDGSDTSSFFITFSPSGKTSADKSTIVNTLVFTPPESISQSTFTRTAVSGQEKIQYQLFRDQDLLTPLYDTSIPLLTRNVLSGSLDPRNGLSLILPYYVSVFPGQFVSPGLYRDKVLVRLYFGTIDRISSARLVFEELLDMSISVPHTMSIAHDGPSGGPAWSKRDLDTTQQKMYALNLDSNVAYSTQVIPTYKKLYTDDKKTELNYTFTKTVSRGQMLLSFVPDRYLNDQELDGLLHEEIWITIEDY